MTGPTPPCAGFTMCPHCQAEYEDPADRRFHAQPNACPVCGPQPGAVVSRMARSWQQGDEALQATAGCCANGGIVAVKGLGGFLLMADARN